MAGLRHSDVRTWLELSTLENLIDGDFRISTEIVTLKAVDVRSHTKSVKEMFDSKIFKLNDREKLYPSHKSLKRLM